MTKTLGQVAFEAGKAAGPVSFVDWEEQSPEYQAGWQAAAEAVVRTMVERELRPAQRAVIEAAKAIVAEVGALERQFGYTGIMLDLCKAIEALQEVEGE